ncbi:MAG: phenylalanine--tRNA ligase subunit beta [Gammaproteobacteria bacterium]|nr:phenylalanine--tRNA ligase subunit beta [Gammaproteobacteria bacterium]
MRFSEQWLREFVACNLTSAEISEQLTMVGLEVDAIEPVGADFSGVVVGQVLSINPHPNADRLQLCEVDIGQPHALAIVCGAKNVYVDMKVAVAIVGAVLPDLKIKRSKIRGVESLGMLCSETELGLTKNIDGIMDLPIDAPIGCDIREYLNLDDNVITIELTPNRGDCLSLLGIAREIVALTHSKLSLPDLSKVKPQIKDKFPVNVTTQAECPHYVGRIIREVNNAVVTPAWMVERLLRSDINTISPLVDITNYVMLELGQPLHAFDLSKLQGSICVRKAKEQEQLTLIDGQKINLTSDMMVIADDKKPQALAGVMGGADSAVSTNTEAVFIESAYFDPIIVSKASRAYGVYTDSSHRFERGVDPKLQLQAIERVTQLICSITGGKVGPINEVSASKYVPFAPSIHLRRERISRVLGVTIGDSKVVEILQALGMQVARKGDGWDVSTPSFRFDLQEEVDIIEELARIYGYNNIPAKQMRADLTIKPCSERQVSLSRIRSLLVDKDYREVVTYSFVDGQLQGNLFAETVQPIKVSNPISSDMSVMRSSLWPGLLKTFLHNKRHQQTRMRFFEVGTVFMQNSNDLLQEQNLAGLIYGDITKEQWGESGRQVDFFDIKGDVEALLQLTHAKGSLQFCATDHPALHPGQSASINYLGNPVGYLGALHPGVSKEFGINKSIYLFEIKLSCVYNALIPEFKVFSKYPVTRRDVAILVGEEVKVEDIISNIKANGLDLLRDVEIFDVYRGEGVADNQKSVALGLVFQHYARTLVDEEIEDAVQVILKGLSNQLNAVIRG